MSVGGKVIESLVFDDRVWVNTREQAGGTECAIYVERTDESRSISNGDSLWWQGASAMWTPKQHPFADRKLKRIGGSGITREQAVRDYGRSDAAR